MTETTPLQPGAPIGPAAPRWMKILLGLSLSANLAVLGMVGGAFLHGAGPRGSPDVRDIGFGPFSEALSQQDRMELRRAFMQDGGDARLMRRQMRSEVGALLQVLRHEPLQEEALRDAFRQFEQRGQERLELGQRLLADRIIAMSPEDRAHFADRLESLLARGSPRGGAPRSGP